jgi:hypothetical protein
LFVAIAALQVPIDARARSAEREKEELLVSSGPALKRLSLGNESLVADMYWTRAVQYYGARMGTPDPNFELLAPLLNITTTLDPKLVVAYRFGAIFLSESSPLGAGRVDLAIDLVKRGIEANPDIWQLHSDLGFLYYWRLKDYRRASAAYLAGSSVPGAPVVLEMMAARVAEKGGSIETSRIIWSQLYESTNDPRVRKRAMDQLRVLKVEEDEAHLNEIAEDYRNRFKRDPASTKEMRDAGMLPGIPVDPAGYPYVISRSGKAQVNPQSTIPEPKP